MMNYYWILVCSALIPSLLSAQGVKISDTPGAPAPSAGLEVDFSNRGFLPPRMTTAERDAIVSPENGLQIFNTSTNCVEYAVNNEWYSLCGTCPAPSAPVASPASGVTGLAFTANWMASSGATSYRIEVSTLPDFSTHIPGFSDLNTGNVTSYGVSGLQYNTTYYYRVRAVNTCGTGTHSGVITVQTQAFICGTTTIAVSHASTDGYSAVNKQVTYGTISFNSKCWTDRNLGASVIASSATDNTESAAGWYWPFNRKQGRQNTGGTNNTPAWIVDLINENSNWTSGNDPCLFFAGSGWRIPTEAEWVSADAAASWSNYNHAYASALKLHAAGFLNLVDGALEHRGNIGTYWSSTQVDNTTAWDLDIQSASSNMYASIKRYALPLRCIRDL